MAHSTTQLLQHIPKTAAALAPLMPGYDATPQAALAIVEYLDQRFAVDAQMKAAILRLLGKRTG